MTRRTAWFYARPRIRLGNIIWFTDLFAPLSPASLQSRGPLWRGRILFAFFASLCLRAFARAFKHGRFSFGQFIRVRLCLDMACGTPPLWQRDFYLVD